MARLHAIAGDCAAKRALGEDVEIEVDAYEPVPARDGDRAKIPRPGRGGGDRRLSRQWLKLWRMRSRIDRDPASKSYMDLAIAAVVDAEGENREMFDLNASPHAAVEKARRRARGRTPAEAADAAS